MITVKKLSHFDFHIWKIMRLESMTVEPNQFTPSEFSYTDQQWADYVNKNICLVAYDDNKPIGMLGCMILQEQPRTHLAYLFGIYVKYEYRRKGIMTKMLDEITIYTKLHKVEQLHLTVVSSNEKAVAGYKKYGFNVYGIQNKALKFGDKYVDEFLMSKHI